MSSENSREKLPWVIVIRRYFYWLIVCATACVCLVEWTRQYRESLFIRDLAKDVVEKAGAKDNRARVIALRDYIRQNVSFHGAPHDGRPFFRATAAETLRSGKGYCGEVTRVFIRMADMVGVRAQRINLYGNTPHVVAEADLGATEKMIVDCQNPPQVAGLEPLDRVILRPEYDNYSTLHLRRWRLDVIISEFKIDLGLISSFIESPHAMKAVFWFSSGLGLVLAMLLKSAKRNIQMEDRLSGKRTNDLDDYLIDKRSVHPWFIVLRCPVCRGDLAVEQETRNSQDGFYCLECDESFPVKNGVPRMLSGQMRLALSGETMNGKFDPRVIATAESFGFEWTHFPEMHAEWDRNFRDYLNPHTPESLLGRRVLDAGCGSGRHAYYAAMNGAEVWAVDLGLAVEVARSNNTGNDQVKVIEADLHRLPFAPESFDLVYSIGVLHHLPDPESVFRGLLKSVKPKGWIHLYLYWKPEGQPFKSALLAGVTAARRITRRIPYRLLYGLSYPAAAIAFAGFVWPYRLLSTAGLSRIAERLPMKQYAQYPFRVCVNDQFDRFSAPIEFRYTRAEVLGWLERAGLENISIRANFGWCATGQKSESAYD